jgi:uncharacterized protein YndB with AHSA1/START domain
VTREITVDAPLEDVWEAISTETGREHWLEPDEDRRIVVEERDAPTHISWWWWSESDNEPARHVDIHVVGIPEVGTRVTVIESRPAVLPVARLQATMEMVWA